MPQCADPQPDIKSGCIFEPFWDEPVALQPSGQGGTNWSPMPYSPDTGYFYVPGTVRSSAFTRYGDNQYVLGKRYVGGSQAIHPQSARDVSWMNLWIAYGVTSVGDMGSDLSTLNAWADRRTGFAAPVPRVFSYGSMIEAMPFIWGGSAFVVSAEQAQEIVRVERQEGAVGLKSYFTLPWSLHRAVAYAGIQEGMAVRAHGWAREEAIRGVLLGHEGIEHMLAVNVYYDDILKLLAATPTRWTPTLPLVFGLMPDASPLRAVMVGTVKRAYQAGVQLLPGTDSLNRRDGYGQGLNAELQHFTQAGIPPLEVLRIATEHSAARWVREISWAACSRANWRISCCSMATPWTTLRTR